MDEIKDFVEIMYERWIRADMHYSFTVEINKRFDKFQLPFKLSSGTVIGKGYKTTESIDKILDHRMFERKIAYSEEMIMSTEMLDKMCPRLHSRCITILYFCSKRKWCRQEVCSSCQGDMFESRLKDICGCKG